jgi:hypothetical protein
MTYLDATNSALNAVDAGRLGTRFKSKLKDLKWIVFKQDASNSTAALSYANDSIALYPELLKIKNPVNAILHEFGRKLLIDSGEAGNRIWTKKLEFPLESSISLAQSTLADPELRKSCKTYKDALNHYPTSGHAVDRLVFIDIANALLANNVAYADSVGIDLKTWGYTSDYCSLKRQHSLIPLTSAYSPYAVHSDFGEAFVAYIVHDFNCVCESSVKRSMQNMLANILSD